MSAFKVLIVRALGYVSAALLLYLSSEGVVSLWLKVHAVLPYGLDRSSAQLIAMAVVMVPFILVLLFVVVDTKDIRQKTYDAMFEEGYAKMMAQLDQVIHDHPFLIDQYKKTLWERKNGAKPVFNLIRADKPQRGLH